MGASLRDVQQRVGGSWLLYAHFAAVLDSEIAERVKPTVSRWPNDRLERGAVEAPCTDTSRDSYVHEHRRGVPTRGLNGVNCLDQLGGRATPAQYPNENSVIVSTMLQPPLGISIRLSILRQMRNADTQGALMSPPGFTENRISFLSSAIGLS